VIAPEQGFPTGVMTSHSVSVPVLPGDHLGVRTGPDSNFSPTYGTSYAGDVWFGPQGSPSPVVGQTTGASSSDFPPPVFTSANFRVNAGATLTSTSAAAPTPTTEKKCKKKKHRRSAQSAKKNCKKHKKK